MGTGFFVAWSTSAGLPQPGDDQKEQGTIYLVTARHVAQVLGSTFGTRFNKKFGSEVETIDDGKWYYYEYHDVDVEILHYGYLTGQILSQFLGRLFVRPGEYQDPEGQIPNVADIGIGDLAYVIGLFNPLLGQSRNLPVVYTGHIALLPEDEKIPVRNEWGGEGLAVEDYLVQAPALEGLSGAPVFARTSLPVYADYRPETEPPKRGGRQAGRMHGPHRASWLMASFVG